MNILIDLAWPVRAEAAPWRNEQGESFEFCVKEWIECQVALGRFPRRSAFAKAVDSGDYCGLFEPCNAAGDGHFLVTPAAMTACIAELGIECNTPSALHHALFELVGAGHLHQQLGTHKLPRLGKHPMYWISAAIRDVSV